MKFTEERTYHCVKCNYELFSSLSKYEHDTPWPAFATPLHEDSLSKVPEENRPLALKFIFIFSYVIDPILLLNLNNLRQTMPIFLRFVFTFIYIFSLRESVRISSSYIKYNKGS
ncbi:Protein of unknown function [Gryllus bimaculatus]|nr:Protein of unknown function [Gryllus bimaculatus]